MLQVRDLINKISFLAYLSYIELYLEIKIWNVSLNKYKSSKLEIRNNCKYLGKSIAILEIGKSRLGIT